MVQLDYAAQSFVSGRDARLRVALVAEFLAFRKAAPWDKLGEGLVRRQAMRMKLSLLRYKCKIMFPTFGGRDL